MWARSWCCTAPLPCSPSAPSASRCLGGLAVPLPLCKAQPLPRAGLLCADPCLARVAVSWCDMEVSQMSPGMLYNQEVPRWVIIAHTACGSTWGGQCGLFGHRATEAFISERLSGKIEGFKYMTFCRNYFNNSLFYCVNCSCSCNNEFHFENANWVPNCEI